MFMTTMMMMKIYMFRVQTRTAGYNYLKAKLWLLFRQITVEGKIIYLLSL